MLLFVPELEDSDRQMVRDGRMFLAQQGIEVTPDTLEALCVLGMMMSQIVERPVFAELWETLGLEFNFEEKTVEVAEILYDTEES